MKTKIFDLKGHSTESGNFCKNSNKSSFKKVEN